MRGRSPRYPVHLSATSYVLRPRADASGVVALAGLETGVTPAGLGQFGFVTAVSRHPSRIPAFTSALTSAGIRT